MASAAVMKLASNPIVRRMAKQVAAQALRGVGRAVQRRRRNGGFRARRRGGRNRFRGSRSAYKQVIAKSGAYEFAPSAVARPSKASSMQGTTFTRVDQALYVDDSRDHSTPFMQPIVPTNYDLFPSLKDVALQYQFFKIKHLSVRWVPNQGTETKGSFAMAVAATRAAAEGIYDYSQLSTLPRSAATNVWASGKNLIVDSEALSKQFLGGQGCAIIDYIDLDADNPEYCPGFLVYNIDSVVNAGDPDKLGYLEVAYSIELIKPKMDTQPSNFSAYLSTDTFSATADWFAALDTKWAAVDTFKTDRLPYTLEFSDTVATITSKSFTPLLVHSIAIAASATNPDVTFAASAGSWVPLDAMSNTSTIYRVGIFFPTGAGDELTLTGANAIIHTGLTIVPVNRRWTDYLRDLGRL